MSKRESATATVTPKIIPLEDDVQVRNKADVSWYWLGIVQDAPFDQLTLGPLDFCKRTAEVNYDPDTKETTRIPHVGRVFQVEDDQIDLAIAAASQKIIRPGKPTKNMDGSPILDKKTGAPVLSRARIFNRNNDQFTRERGDRIAADFVFVLKTDEDGPRRNTIPKTLSEMARG